MFKKIILIGLVLIALNSCTDASIAGVQALGKEHKVTLYSGGVAVKEWTSTGKVMSMTDSDGWKFKNKETGKLVRVGGNVTIEVLD